MLTLLQGIEEQRPETARQTDTHTQKGSAWQDANLAIQPENAKVRKSMIKVNWLHFRRLYWGQSTWSLSRIGRDRETRAVYKAIQTGSSKSAALANSPRSKERETHVQLRSPRHYLQQLEHDSNLDVHQDMTGQRRCGTYIDNGILLSHKKGQTWVICRDVDGPRVCHTEYEVRNRKTNTRCCCCQVASVMSDSVRPQRRQPTRLPRPWDSPGKNTGEGCHFLLQCMKVKRESEVA